MLFAIISFVLVSIVLILANDIMFNKKRKKPLKIIEFIICILFICSFFIIKIHFCT